MGKDTPCRGRGGEEAGSNTQIRQNSLKRKAEIKDGGEHYVRMKGSVQEGSTLMQCVGNQHRSTHIHKASRNRPEISLREKATHSAHTVFPADVCADTKTDWLLSTH